MLLLLLLLLLLDCYINTRFFGTHNFTHLSRADIFLWQQNCFCLYELMFVFCIFVFSSVTVPRCRRRVCLLVYLDSELAKADKSV